MAGPQDPTITTSLFKPAKVEIKIPLISANPNREPAQPVITAQLKDHDPFNITFGYFGDKELQQRGFCFQHLVDDVAATYKIRHGIFTVPDKTWKRARASCFDCEKIARANMANVSEVYRRRQAIEDGMKWDLGQWQKVAELEICLTIRQIVWMELAMDSRSNHFAYFLPGSLFEF